MKRRPYKRFALALVGVLTACGGGGGGGGGLPVTTPTVAPTATPTVSPTATPTTAPTQTPAALSLSISSVSLSGSGAQSSFTASESGYTGALTAQVDPSCAGIVSGVTPSSANGPSATFTLTTGTAAGTCSIHVADGSGQQASLSVSVAQVGGVLQ